MKALTLLAVLWLVRCSTSPGMAPQTEPADDQAPPVTEPAPAVPIPNLTGSGAGSVLFLIRMS